MQLKLDTSKTYAIALEGGGAKGAYEIGAWKALEEAGLSMMNLTLMWLPVNWAARNMCSKPSYINVSPGCPLWRY